jgi:hypothetical protein
VLELVPEPEDDEEGGVVELSEETGSIEPDEVGTEYVAVDRVDASKIVGWM